MDFKSGDLRNFEVEEYPSSAEQPEFVVANDYDGYYGFARNTEPDVPLAIRVPETGIEYFLEDEKVEGETTLVDGARQKLSKHLEEDVTAYVGVEEEDMRDMYKEIQDYDQEYSSNGATGFLSAEDVDGTMRTDADHDECWDGSMEF